MRRRVFVVVFLAIVLLPALAVARPHASTGDRPPEAATVAEAQTRPFLATDIPEDAIVRASARRSFARLQRRLGARVGMIVSPAVAGARTLRFGHDLSGPSHSTIKVPISHAVMARYGGYGNAPARLRRDIRAAIRRSDNVATQRLYNSFGSATDSARQIERALAAGGDRNTRVVPGGAWGGTIWKLRRQMRYAQRLRCMPYSKAILAQMRLITRSQRWGLGRLPRRPAFKGGWSPGAGFGGGYLVRQMGQFSPAPGKVVAVAMYAKPFDGSLATGTKALSRMARWLSRQVLAERVTRPACT